MFGKTLPLREKLRAAGAFSGIAVASVVALDVLVTNGWQIDPPPTRLEVSEPSPTYISMMDGGWRSDYTYSSLSWNDQMPIDDQAAAPEPLERLAGSPDGDDPNYRNAYYNVPSEEDLYREIAALYADQDARAAEAEERREERAGMLEAQARTELQAVEEVVREDYQRVAIESADEELEAPLADDENELPVVEEITTSETE